AALGTLFADKVRSEVVSSLSALPGVGPHAQAIAAGLVQGNGPASSAAGLPAQARAQVSQAAHAAFAHGLNEILWIGSAIALVSAVACFFSIRSQDFAQGSAQHGQRQAAP